MNKERSKTQMSEDLYELLKQKDALIEAYARLVEALRSRFAAAATECAEDEAWSRAYKELDGLFYEYGFRSNGDPR